MDAFKGALFTVDVNQPKTLAEAKSNSAAAMQRRIGVAEANKYFSTLKAENYLLQCILDAATHTKHKHNP
jgi:hypothetical protein